MTAPRPTPDAELTAARDHIRVTTDEEADLLRSMLLAAWAAVEEHTGRLWVPAANDGDRTAAAELWANGGDSVPLLPAFPETPGAVLATVERWTDGAWTALVLADLDRPDPWTFRAPAAATYRVTATYQAGAIPEHVQRAVYLAASYSYEFRGDVAFAGQTPATQAGALLRSGAADLLRHDRRVSL